MSGMNWRRSASISLTALIAIVGAVTAARAATTYDAVAPIFSARCIVCHSGEFAPLGLRLDARDNILKGSQRGPVVKPNDAAGSELIKRIKGQSLPRMPLTGPPYLADAEIALIEKWVAEGAQAASQPSAAAAPVTPPAPARPKPGETVTYRHVQPIFLQRCVKCHSPNSILGAPPEGFRLDSLEQALAVGERVRIVPGNPDASELARRIRGQSLPRMPFDGPPYLPDDDIKLIEQWIKQGARDADGKPAPSPTGARVRLHGVLTNEWALDGMPLIVDGGTRIDKRPRVGDYVEVRGTVQNGGAIRADRIRRR